MTAEENRIIAQKWLEAFNAHDLEKLLELYHPSAEHYSPKLKIHNPQSNGFVQGKEQLKGWWKDAFDRLPGLHYQMKTLTATTERVFLEYIRKVAGEEEFFVAEVLEINNGLITASRVYHG